MFFDKAYELKDTLITLINDTSIETSPTPAVKGDIVAGSRKIDVMRYLAQATLDVIGLAGFNYDFRSMSLTEGPNELAEAYRSMFQATQSIDSFAIAQAFIKPLRYLVSLISVQGDIADKQPSKRTRKILESRTVTEKIGRVGGLVKVAEFELTP
jgi:hypothetical protein